MSTIIRLLNAAKQLDDVHLCKSDNYGSCYMESLELTGLIDAALLYRDDANKVDNCIEKLEEYKCGTR